MRNGRTSSSEGAVEITIMQTEREDAHVDILAFAFCNGAVDVLSRTGS